MCAPRAHCSKTPTNQIALLWSYRHPAASQGTNRYSGLKALIAPTHLIHNQATSQEEENQAKMSPLSSTKSTKPKGAQEGDICKLMTTDRASDKTKGRYASGRSRRVCHRARDDHVIVHRQNQRHSPTTTAAACPFSGVLGMCLLWRSAQHSFRCDAALSRSPRGMFQPRHERYHLGESLSVHECHSSQWRLVSVPIAPFFSSSEQCGGWLVCCPPKHCITRGGVSTHGPTGWTIAVRGWTQPQHDRDVGRGHCGD